MALDDDAALAAVEMTRRALLEQAGQPAGDPDDVLADVWARHGRHGVVSLAHALACNGATALARLAEQRGQQVLDLVDEGERQLLHEVADVENGHRADGGRRA
jgi:hypothetical protein